MRQRFISLDRMPTLRRRESLLHDVALALVRTDPATAAAEGLGVIARACDADRAWLVRFDDAMTQWWVAAEWCAPGVMVCLPDLPGVPIAFLARPLVDLRRGRPVVYRDIEKIPADAQVLKEEMRREGNKATAGTPLFVGGRLVGLIGLDDVRKTHRWSMKLMRSLAAPGELILAAAERASTLAKPSSIRRRNAASAFATTPPPRPSPDGCYLRAGNCHVQVHWDEIVSISAEDDYSRVRLHGGQEFLEPRPLAVWVNSLPDAKFGRVHRSWIVGWRHVLRLRRASGGRWDLELRGRPGTIPVGRSHQASVRFHLNLRAP